MVPYTALIFTCNRLADLRRCLASVREQTTPPREIVIIDNNSTDGTAEWLEQSDLTVYKNDKKHLAYLFNFGWKRVADKLILFLADDVEIEREWAECALPWMEEPDVGAVSGPLISSTKYASEMHRLYVTGQRSQALRPIVKLYAHLVLEEDPMAPGRYFESGAYSFGQGLRQDYEGARSIDLLTTSAMLIRKEALQQLEGFDERFLFNHADGDLFLRMGKAGFRLIFEPRSLAQHHVRMGPSRNPFIIGRDTAIFHRKHLRPRTLRGVMGALFNIAILNAYWIYAAIAQRDPKQLQGITGYLYGAIR